MSIQRFRSNSSSSTLVTPLSPTHSNFIGTTSNAIDIPASNAASSYLHDRILQESFATAPNHPRLSLSPMGGAAGVMKKLWRRRRGNTTGSGCDGDSPLGQSFIIVGGIGSSAGGVSLHDDDQPLSPTESNLSPFTIALTSPKSPTMSMASPKSPTFSQSMFARKTQPSIDSISAPIMIPLRCHPQSNGSLSYAPATGNSLTLSSASSGRKRINRRSLSADGLWVANIPQQIKDQQNSVYADNLTPKSQQWKQTSMDTLVSKHSAAEDSLVEKEPGSAVTLDQDHGAKQQSDATPELRPTEPEFYQSSVEFLSIHGHTHTSGDWVNRNKRKTLVPKRRQSESNLLCNIAKTAQVANSLHLEEEPAPRGAMGDDSERPSTHGPEEWSNEHATAAPASGIDAEEQSLVSSVDVLLRPSISTPTQYYDSAEARKLLRTYLTSEGRRFEEMVEFGFPGTGLVESAGSTDHSRFLTLRLTLTPWHAREDESKLYGPDDDDVDKHAPIKGMVNKFLSRTSAILSCSPPRTLSSSPTPDSRAVSSKDQRSTASHALDDASVATRGPRDATDFERGPVASWREGPEVAAANDARVPQYSPPKRMDSVNRIVPPPKSSSRVRPGPKKDRGFRILDPATLSVSSSTIRSVRSAEFLKSDPEFCASPPSTPSPTAVFNHLQQQQLPRKGSLSSLSLSESATLRRPTPEASAGSTTTSAPIIPPRRKASSPAILLNCDVNTHRNPKQRPSVFTPDSPANFGSLSKARQGSLQSNAPFQELQRPAVMTSADVLSTSPPSPSPIISATDSTPPIPIPSAKKLQTQQHQWTDYHVYGAPSARMPRTPLNNNRSDLSESTPEPMILTPRHDLMMTMTTTPM
ncbi:hypothetical protein BGZ72_009502 [Mortierella alpina]|nr:hypothetical protein BGZ72_009502 [Mortierella alpina]